MEKKFTEDNELKELLIEQYIKEAEAMEAALFADEDFEDLEMTDEEVQASYDKLVGRLKAEGIYREDVDAEENADDGDTAEINGTVPCNHDKIIPMSAAADEEKDGDAAKTAKTKKNKSRSGGKKHTGLAKVAGLVLVCCLSVFAGSMTSEANRRYFVNAIKVFSGNDTKIVIDNNEANENINESEYWAIESIEKQLNIDVPEFLYRPASLRFVKYEVTVYSGVARMEYMYGNNIMLLYVNKQSDNKKSSSASFHGEEVIQVISSKDDIEIEIKKIQNPKDLEASYFAQWERENVMYYFTGKMEEKEFAEILSQMKY